MNSTQLRDRAHVLAREDPDAALAVARQVPEPWFRAQALAAVARWSSDQQVERLVREALVSADKCEDHYGRAAVAAWPIRALVERGRETLAAKALAGARQHALAATPVGSRAEALFSLLEGSWHLGADSRRQLVEDLLRLQGQDTHWRVGRALVRALGMLGPIDRELAKSLAAKVVDDRSRAKVEAAIEAEKPGGPREYFFST